MFHPESNPLAPKSSGPKKPEKELVRVWLGDAAAAEMEERGHEAGDEDLNQKGHELTEQEKKKLWEMKRPDEVTLKNIPTWKELPDEETFKKEFKLAWIWKEEYRKGRSISDFAPRSGETRPSFQTKETLPYAKVFDITDAIIKAQEKDPEHDENLSTSEVLEAIDAAGYRPATLEELVAYARDYWKPDADPKTLTKAEREIQNAQALEIASLNPVFSGSGGHRLVPYLGWDGAERGLRADVLGDDWNADCRFLVLRKSLSS